ncbi:unnamed protein product [Boreogadus saida]
MEDPPTDGGVTATYIRNSDKMYVYSRRVDKFVWIRRLLPYVTVRTPELGNTFRHCTVEQAQENCREPREAPSSVLRPAPELPLQSTKPALQPLAHTSTSPACLPDSGSCGSGSKPAEASLMSLTPPSTTTKMKDRRRRLKTEVHNKF